MNAAYLPLIPIALFGCILRSLLPQAEEIRLSLNKAVFYVFLPALVFRTVMESPLDSLFLEVPLSASLTILSMLLTSFLVFRYLPIPEETKGAMILAATFGNVTYLGLPILQHIFPTHLPEIAEVVVLYEVTKSSLNLSLGAMVAIYFGSHERITFGKTIGEALRLPPIWALALALGWKTSGFPCPSFLLESTGMLASSVTAIMILSVGMALRFRVSHLMVLLLPVAILKLIVSPYMAFRISDLVGLHGLTDEALILEAAMPSQLLSFVIAGRFKLDEATLAFVILADTLLSLITLPLVTGLLPMV